MSISKLIRATALAGAVAAASLLAAAPALAQEDITIAYSGYPTSQPFWAGVAAAAKAEAEAQGITFQDISTPDADAAAQKDAIDRAINAGVDGILLGAIDNRAFDDTLAKAEAAGIPVVTVDTGIDHPWVKSLVQTDNLAAAGLAGKFIVENAKPGTVLIVGGTEGHQTGNARRDGVMQAAEAAGWKVIFQICDWKDDCAYQTTLNQTRSNPDITAVFAAWDPGALAAVSAAKENGNLANLTIVGFDGNPGNLESIKAGEQTATIKQDNTRMGQEGVRNLLALIRGEEVAPFTGIDGILITKDNVDEFIQ